MMCVTIWGQSAPCPQQEDRNFCAGKGLPRFAGASRGDPGIWIYNPPTPRQKCADHHRTFLPVLGPDTHPHYGTSSPVFLFFVPTKNNQAKNTDHHAYLSCILSVLWYNWYNFLLYASETWQETFAPSIIIIIPSRSRSKNAPSATRRGVK